ncbi:hypothetical protein BP6252_02758 [Coleophoma cylindrospora]|uniref:Uncharacterized protein n=1 Tax=Coleophoma cylindrospora TaxID=1849047 RepID=A0A3D8SHD6_9HELO|nr:hypothetical protein BP6252_02758 [Coleophoma cylindrospora]
MAEAFGIGAGIVGVVGLAIQVSQVIVQFGMDWKDAPDSVKAFMAELGTLKTVLSETYTNILVNRDFEAAFSSRPSLLLSQLGPNAPPTTDTNRMLDRCRTDLQSLLNELKKRGQGHRLGWERIKGAFLAKGTRESVENLCRQCQTLNSMLSVDAAVLGVTTYKEVREARKEQQEWHQADTETFSAIKCGVDQSNRWQENRDSQEILNWITPIDYAAQQSDFIGRRQDGTGQWLLDSVEFQTWLQTPKKTLFCPGIPGAGKTILTSIVVEQLKSRFVDNKSIGIAYLYCNFRRQDTQNTKELLSSLLRQLSEGQSSVPGIVKDLHERHESKRTSPSLDEVSRAVKSVTSLYSRVFIVIDALDECQQGCRKLLLSEISSLQTDCEVNFFATSRFIPDITRIFDGDLWLEIRASKGDIERYLDAHMADLSTFDEWDQKLQDEIKTGISDAVDGMFLLAQIYLSSLDDKTTPRAVRTALMQFRKQIPGSSEDQKREVLDKAYNDAMERINAQKLGFRRLAQKVLSWITCAKRPLSAVELLHALAIEVGDSKLDEDNFERIERLISVCAGLVTIDEESSIVRLVHYTTQEYFERTQNHWFPDAEVNITEICIAYLSFGIFEHGSCQTDDAFEKRLQSNQFFDYAARNWGHHARKAPNLKQALINSILDFLNSQDRIDASSQGLLAAKRHPRHEGYSQQIPKRITGLHLLGYFGEKVVLQLLLEKGSEIEAKDTYGRTPLIYTAQQGYEAVVKLLLEKGAEIEAKDTYGRTPLMYAAGGGEEAAVKLLLEKGAEIEAKDTYGRTPLTYAAQQGYEAVVKLLLEKGAEIEAKDTDGRTPLMHAAERGYEAIVKLLLEKGAEIEAKDSRNGWTPLMYAAERGHEAVVKLLLEKGAEIEAKGTYGRTPLMYAAQWGREAVVKLLLEKGAEIDAKYTDGRTPLMHAAERGYEAIVKLLLEKGAEIEAKDTDGRTPLMYAAQWGREAVVKLLLEKGAEIEAKDTDGRTPLMHAAERGYEAIVKLLLEKGAEIEAKDTDGRTPLMYAAQWGREAVVKLLLEKGAEIEAKDTDGWTLLMLAAQRGYEAIVKLLLEKGAEIEAKDTDGRTPLMYAAQRGHEAVVKLLIDEGGNWNAEDNNGWTALLLAVLKEHNSIKDLFIIRGAAEPEDIYGFRKLFSCGSL